MHCSIQKERKGAFVREMVLGMDANVKLLVVALKASLVTRFSRRY